MLFRRFIVPCVAAAMLAAATAAQQRDPKQYQQILENPDRIAALQQAGVTMTAPPHTAGGVRSAMIEGPDRLAIELVESR